MDIRQSLEIVEAKPRSNILKELTGYRQSAVVPAFKSAMAGINTGYHPKSVRAAKLQQFLALMREKGFEPISNGSFGAVFTLPGLDYVVKIFKDDAAYLTFLRYVEQHPSNPNLPRLRGRCIDLGDSHAVVRIEKLKPVPDNTLRRGLCEVFNRIFKTTSVGLACDELIDFNDQVDFALGHKRFVANGVKTIVREDPGLFFTLKDLVQHLGSHELDLYPSNFMLRGRKNVIIDPFADLNKLISADDLAFFAEIGNFIKAK